MKRTKLLGLCLIAAFAFSVMVAASAQAAKLGTGAIAVLSTNEGEAELGNSIANIRCKSHTARSEIVGATSTEKVVALYKGCEVAGKGISCTNKGDGSNAAENASVFTQGPTSTMTQEPFGEATAEGEIETKRLRSSLNWISQSKGEVGVDFWPETEAKPAAKGAGVATLAVFDCKGFAEIKVFGSIIGIATPKNEMVEAGKVKFEEKEFKNVPNSFEGGPPEELEAEFNFNEGPQCTPDKHVPKTGKYKDLNCTELAGGLETEKLFEKHEGTPKVASGQIQGDNTHNHGISCKVKAKKGHPTTEKCKGNPAMVDTASGKPQYGRCTKKGVAKTYTDEKCQHLPVGKEKAKYGFAPIPAGGVNS